MQQALKNPHYKKIWEEVNWKIRHPEANNLEEALFLETHNADCNILHCGLNIVVFMQCLCLLKSSGFNLGNKAYHSFSQSFGRPITLEDILLLLAQNGKIGNEIGIILFENGNLYIKPQTGGGYDFEWKYSKSLDEQSPETWEKISELIK